VRKDRVDGQRFDDVPGSWQLLYDADGIDDNIWTGDRDRLSDRSFIAGLDVWDALKISKNS